MIDMIIIRWEQVVLKWFLEEKRPHYFQGFLSNRLKAKRNSQFKRTGVMMHKRITENVLLIIKGIKGWGWYVYLFVQTLFCHERCPRDSAGIQSQQRLALCVLCILYLRYLIIILYIQIEQLNERREQTMIESRPWYLLIKIFSSLAYKSSDSDIKSTLKSIVSVVMRVRIIHGNQDNVGNCQESSSQEVSTGHDPWNGCIVWVDWLGPEEGDNQVSHVKQDHHLNQGNDKIKRNEGKCYVHLSRFE